jgi:hypothetical protein
VGCNCSAERLVSVDAPRLAAGLNADLSNVSAFLERLAHTLEGAVADRTRVERHGAEIVAIELNLAPDVFLAKREGRDVVTQHKRTLRGIALKTATHPLDLWVEMLCEALAAHANENTRATAAVAAILGDADAPVRAPLSNRGRGGSSLDR